MTAPLSLIGYRWASFLATPLAGPILAMRLRRGKEDSRRVGERRGLTGLVRPPGPLVWLHGASVGEAGVLLPFVERITRMGATALVTTTTVTSAAMLAQRLPAGALHQYAPLDSPVFVRRFIKRWRPDAALVAESELWPNMIVELKRSKSRLAMINGRISERSFRRWGRAPRFIAALLAEFDVCLARSEEDGDRLSTLGAPNVLVAGDIKFDAPTLPADRRELAELAGLTSGRQMWIAASTHEGEEMIAAAAHKRLAQVFPDALTLIAPRHPERGEWILRQLEGQGLSCALRSRGETIGPGTAVYICDTIGELGLFYRLAGVVFVGKSFVAGGGQNPIEPARLASAILHGPMVGNFADAYAALDEAGGALARRAPGGLGGDADLAVRQCGAAARHGARGRRYGRAPRGGGRPLDGRAEKPVAVRRGGAVKAPRFWSKPRPTLLARLLQPTGWAYGRATAQRMRGQGERAGAPTICVGNFTVGGAGKTPTALALARMLIGDGRRVAFLSRGYGGAERAEPLLVDADTHNAAEVGDEPLLLAKLAQCWVGADRVRSARSAVEAGADTLILDDGLQNPGLVKDLSFAVVDGESGFGNGLCVPAGPLRAPRFGAAAVRAGADRAGRRRRGGVSHRRFGARQAAHPREPRARRACRGALDRTRSRRLRRHCATGEILRHPAPGRGADRRHARFRRPSSLHAARGRGVDRGIAWARRAAGDDRKRPGAA